MESGGQGRARGRGVATRQNTKPGGRRPGEEPSKQQKPTGAASGRGQPKQESKPHQAAGRATQRAPLEEGELSGQGGITRGGGNGNGGNGNGATGRGAMRGGRYIGEALITRPSTVIEKRGSGGREVTLQANYFRITKRPQWEMLQYRVDFAPEIELMRVRKGMLYEHRNVLGGYLFDGTMLFTSKKLNDPTELVCRNREGESVKVTIKYTGLVKMGDWQSLQILNIILRKSMEGLKLQLVGRNFFDAIAKTEIREYRIELWPGYQTSIRQHERDILLCAEVAHKVMRTETIYDILQKCINQSRNYQDIFKKEIIGMIVLTDYNNKTYRVDDVDFRATPRSTFGTKDGGQLNFVDYYKNRYNIRIRDENQPLLISQAKEKTLRGGGSDLILLVPELCRATGLNDSMRTDFQLMRAMSAETRLPPKSRIERLKAFNQRLFNTPASMDVLSSWELGMDSNLIEIKGRILPPENIVFGEGKRVPAGVDADWTRSFRNMSMYESVKLENWCVLATTRCMGDTRELIKSIKQAANGMRMLIRDPQILTLPDDRNATYTHKIEESCNSDPQLIMAIVPNNNAERYNSIKKKTCIDRAVPTQVVVHRTIMPKGGSYRGLMSVATKIAIQMNCKLMGAPWQIEMPLKGLMTIGFDVCHSARDKAKSYGALVATMDLKTSSRFYSTVSEHNRGQELSNDMSLKVAQALRQYREIHGTLPQRILFYRDGVGEGQIEYVFNHELKIVKEKLQSLYKSAGHEEEPRFAFIVVSKRINTRYFYNQENPPPGTIVDDVITIPVRYDFYLVSQSVKQGTVSPTHYNIIHDNIGLNSDRLQILTYKMTHMYYNWSGTTRVPAVCQYAHKLAFLVAQSLHNSPSNLLEKQLYYL